MPKSTRTKRPTALVVDDDPSVLRALKRLLCSHCIDVLTFDRPSGLLAADFPEGSACLIIDINLPEMNGVQLYKALVASERGLPVIMITGGDEAFAQRLMRGIDAVALLSKPFDESVLCEAISRACSQSANQGRLP